MWQPSGSRCDVLREEPGSKYGGQAARHDRFLFRGIESSEEGGPGTSFQPGREIPPHQLPHFPPIKSMEFPFIKLFPKLPMLQEKTQKCWLQRRGPRQSSCVGPWGGGSARRPETPRQPGRMGGHGSLGFQGPGTFCVLDFTLFFERRPLKYKISALHSSMGSTVSPLGPFLWLSPNLQCLRMCPYLECIFQGIMKLKMR